MDSLPLISAVLVASLLGSAHCVGMCGAFVAFAVSGDLDRGTGERGTGDRGTGDRGTGDRGTGDRGTGDRGTGDRGTGDSGNGTGDDPTTDRRRAPSRTRLQVMYHGGRLVTYTALGALGGALGAAVDLGGNSLGIQRVALTLAGACMLLFAATALLRTLGARIPRAPLPSSLKRLVAAGHRAAMGLRPDRRALAIGMLTTLLPCGWLYAFAITAAGTGSPVLGAVVMVAFWLGTLPALAALGYGVQSLTGVLGRRLPIVTSIVLAAVGLWTLMGRTRLPALAEATADRGALRSIASGEASTEDAIERVQSLEHEEMPCCQQ